MSKIGRKPISLGSVKVDITDNTVTFRGKNNSGTYTLPKELRIEVADNQLKLVPAPNLPAEIQQDINRLWGLHRASLANALIGADKGFEKQIRIIGLGYKATSAGSKLQFSLGFSHKIDFPLPEGIKVEIDKTGQLLTCKAANKEMLGLVCSKIRALRPPEPYKGTGIQYVNEVIRRKAGKAKSA